MLTLVEYDPADIRKIKMNAELLEQNSQFGNPIDLMAQFHANQLIDINTFLDEETSTVHGIIMCFPVHKGVGHVWIITDDEMLTKRAFVRRFARLCKAKMDYMVQRWQLHRIQASVKADFKRGIRFAKHFGFEEEGLLKRFSPAGDDYLMMSKTDFTK